MSENLELLETMKGLTVSSMVSIAMPSKYCL